MNQEVKNINVNDFEVVKETKEKTLWDFLTDQQKNNIKHHVSEFSALYENVIPSLQKNDNHLDLTILEYQNILRCIGYSLIAWVNPYDIFKYES